MDEIKSRGVRRGFGRWCFHKLCNEKRKALVSLLSYETKPFFALKMTFYTVNWIYRFEIISIFHEVSSKRLCVVGKWKGRGKRVWKWWERMNGNTCTVSNDSLIIILWSLLLCWERIKHVYSPLKLLATEHETSGVLKEKWATWSKRESLQVAGRPK